MGIFQKTVIQLAQGSSHCRMSRPQVHCTKQSLSLKEIQGNEANKHISVNSIRNMILEFASVMTRC
jgi:hypothetical protein